MKCYGYDLPTMKGRILVDFSGHRYESVPCFHQQGRSKCVALYFKILLAGYLTASNEGSFTDEKLLFSAWFTLFLCMNIHSLIFFFFLRIDMNSQTFSSSFLYDLIIYCIIRRYKAWSVSSHFKIHFYLHAHVPSLDSVGMYSVTFVLLRLTRPEQIWP